MSPSWNAEKTIPRTIEWTGDLGDLAQRVGSRLQLMLAR